MNSVCIKTNNNKILEYLLNDFYKINLDDTFLTQKKFKFYENIIIHSNSPSSIFYNKVSNILTRGIINLFEKDIIKRLLDLNYFYFDTFEKNQILFNTMLLLKDGSETNKRYDLINNSVYAGLLNNHNFYINGFINFRLSDYVKFLSEQVDIAVNKFLIDKEYTEFVSLLKLYINSESSKSNIEHLNLIYNKKNSIIVDNNKNIISTNNITKSKFISDISFSSNDFALNTLLNLLPKKITIHLIDNNQDEFINTLKIIFEDRIILCNDCDICNFYRNHCDNYNYLNH